MHWEAISNVPHMRRERWVRKKARRPLKLGFPHSILPPAANGFRCKRYEKRTILGQTGPQFSLSFFSPPFHLFLDSRQTGKATIKNAARGNVERGIGYFAQV